MIEAFTILYHGTLWSLVDEVQHISQKLLVHAFYICGVLTHDNDLPFITDQAKRELSHYLHGDCANKQDSLRLGAFCSTWKWTANAIVSFGMTQSTKHWVIFNKASVDWEVLLYS